MRTIHRDQIQCPNVLADGKLVATATEKYGQAKNKRAVNSGLYRHDEVVSALSRLYFKKCYLCEADAAKDGVVEHFLPHDPECPERAYAWRNLHWACDKCNKRKTRGVFNEYCADRPNVVERTLLVDPSNLPEDCCVEEMITFSGELEACATERYSGDLVVERTAEFLNDSLPQRQRDSWYHGLADVLIEEGCIQAWRELSLVELEVSSWPTVKRDDYLRSAEVADRVFVMYLSPRKPFCTSMRRALEERLRVSAALVQTLGWLWRKYSGKPEAYPAK